MRKKAYEMLKETCCKVDCMPDKIYKDERTIFFIGTGLNGMNIIKKFRQLKAFLINQINCRIQIVANLPVMATNLCELERVVMISKQEEMILKQNCI